MTCVEKQKQALREEALRRRDAVDALERQQRGEAACERLFAEIAAAACNAGLPSVALSDSMGSEAPTGHLVDLALQAGWSVCLPVLHRTDPAAAEGPRAMSFVTFDADRLQIARKLFLGHPLRTVDLAALADAGIPAVSPQCIDAFVVPLVAFDAAGRRLGYGGGYYDAVLAQVMSESHRRGGRQPFVSGLAFAEQQVDRVPAEPHDIPLPRIEIA